MEETLRGRQEEVEMLKTEIDELLADGRFVVCIPSSATHRN